MRWLNQQWYKEKRLFAVCLSPFSLLYRSVIAFRRMLYRFGLKKISRLSVPVIVVGNITVGGTGKTPLVVWLVQWLQSKGFKPGLVSRGYSGRATEWPQAVTSDSDPVQVGDEAVLLVKKTGCPMVVGPDRVAAARKLLANNSCDFIISDDGLQHTAMGRDIEIVVIDGLRRFGNGFCLPAGPLREPIKRLNDVDFVVVNGEAQSTEYAMTCSSGAIYNIKNPDQLLNVESMGGKKIHAVAGIGHPQRFFQQLKVMGFQIIPHEFSDHHAYVPSDLAFDDGVIIMTEKDAVKCQRFSDKRLWCLPLQVIMDERFVAQLAKSVSAL